MTVVGFGYRRPDPRSGLEILGRQDFGNRFAEIYEDGDHMVIGGPSTGGKTQMAFDLLPKVTSINCPAFVAQSKPNDKVVDERGKALGYRFVSKWPPKKKLAELLDKKNRPKGYIIRPPFGVDINTDMDRCAKLTADLIGDRYTAGAKGKHGILVMDDTMVKAKILRLDRQMVTIVAMASSMGLGEWVFIQKPTDSGDITLWAYENAKHCLFTKGGDSRMLKRYAEIAGDRSMEVMTAVPGLKEYQFVYLYKPKGFVCIVDRS
jgi:hypothetical protein